MRAVIFKSLIILGLVALSLAADKAKPAAADAGKAKSGAGGSEHHDEHEEEHHRPGDPDISSKSKHFDDEGHHDDSFDHDAVTGSHKEAEEFKELSPEESKKRLGELVVKMDINKDGFVVLDELKQWIINSFKNLDLEDAKQKLEDHDENNDKKVAFWEYVEKSYGYKQKEVEQFKKEKAKDMQHFLEMLEDDKKKFDLADVNRDGFLDVAEYAAFAHPVNYPRMAPHEIARTMKDYDKNKDGAIDKAEFLGTDTMDEKTKKAEEEHFQEYDVNKNGKLEGEEIRKWVMPGFEHSATQEANHLIKETDADKDGKLSKKEIVDKNDLWVGSQATDYGKHLDDMKKDEL